MKRSEIYREAARLLERRDTDYLGCCWAINASAPGSQRLECVVAFGKWFKPRGVRVNEFYWTFSKENIGCRILALCFMAALAEAEETEAA